jgi:hypothetical protein
MTGSTEDVVNGHTHSVRRRNLIFPGGGIILVKKLCFDSRHRKSFVSHRQGADRFWNSPTPSSIVKPGKTVSGVKLTTHIYI